MFSPSEFKLLVGKGYLSYTFNVLFFYRKFLLCYTGISWTVYSLSYDSSQNFYFFVEMATLILPTTLSDIEDLLPSFLENLLALRVCTE
jgi:hypothetical protein